jgi:hypothetical protein
MIDLVSQSEEILDSNDSIVITNAIECMIGGRSLDVTGYSKTVIKGGHPIIKETATGKYKPMPLNSGGTAFAALPSGHVYVGVNYTTILTAKPMCSIMTRGTVNKNAVQFDISGIAAAITTATANQILFTSDKI